MTRAHAELRAASARGVFWNFFQTVVGRVLGLIVVAILGRILDRQAFGAVALGLAVMAFVDTWVSQGFAEFIVQRTNLDDEHINTAFWTNVGLGLAGTTGIFCAAQPIAGYFGEPGVANIVRWLSLGVVLRSLAIVPTGLLIRSLKFRSLSVRSLLTSVVGGGLGIAAALAGWGAMSLVLQTMASDVLAVLALWLALKWRPSLQFSKASLRDIFRYSLPTFGASLLAYLSRRFDTVIIARVLGLPTLGAYSMAQRVFQIANQVLNKSGDSVALSAFSRLADAVEQRLQAFYTSIELTAAVCFPAYAGLAVVSQPFVSVLFGSRWHDAATIISAFAIGGLPLSLSYIHAAALKASGNTRFILVSQIVISILYLGTLSVLVHSGITAAAATYSMTCFVVSPIEVLLLGSAIGVRFGSYLRRLAGISAATLLMAAAAWGATRLGHRLPSLAQLALAVLVAGPVYVTALRLFAPSTFVRAKQGGLALLTRVLAGRAARAPAAPAEPLK